MTAAAQAHAHPRSAAKVARVAVEKIRANPHNIRTNLGDLRELAEAIRHEGVLVPLMAEDHGSHLQLLHGHRRWAAAQLAGVRRVPVVIVELHDPHDAILLMLAEDKKQPIDQTDKRRAVRVLRDEFGMTWQAIADRLGISLTEVRAWASGTTHFVRRGTPSRPGPHREDRPASPPSIGPTALHRMLELIDAGHLTPEALVDNLREHLGGWRPKSATAHNRSELGSA